MQYQFNNPLSPLDKQIYEVTIRYDTTVLMPVEMNLPVIVMPTPFFRKAEAIGKFSKTVEQEKKTVAARKNFWQSVRRIGKRLNAVLVNDTPEPRINDESIEWLKKLESSEIKLRMEIAVAEERFFDAAAYRDILNLRQPFAEQKVTMQM